MEDFSMVRREQETGKRVTVIGQRGTEFELIEFIELLNEEGFEVEGRTVLRTPGGLEAVPKEGEEGKFVVEGTGGILTLVRITQAEEAFPAGE
jgi:hypothetical protein